MGIRFFCPNGHRLNVKEYLAGRTGFCPDCGERVMIPLESDPAAKRKRKSGDGAAEQSADKDDVEGEVRLGEGGPQEGGSIVLSSSGAATSGGVAAPAEPFAASSAGAVEPPMPGAAPAAYGGDPLSEVPTAQWYVRPPAGGQFGPATNDIMRSWIAEGRVVADALVWRDDWPQWQSAADVFPSVRKPIPPSASPPPSLIGLLEEQPDLAAMPTPAPAAHRLPSPHVKKNYLNIVITILLGILVLLLGVLLVVVLRGRMEKEEEPEEEPAATAWQARDHAQPLA